MAMNMASFRSRASFVGMALLPAFFGFTWYGELRTFAGTFGFEIAGALFSTFFTAFFVFGMILPVPYSLMFAFAWLMRRWPLLRLILPVANIIALCGLWIYWRSNESASAPLIVGAAVLLTIVPTLLAAVLPGAERVRMKSAVPLIALALLAGCSASELWILRDEHVFRQEVEGPQSDKRYVRVRAWPFDSTHLVYDPQYGFRATDD